MHQVAVGVDKSEVQCHQVSIRAAAPPISDIRHEAIFLRISLVNGATFGTAALTGVSANLLARTKVQPLFRTRGGKIDPSLGSSGAGDVQWLCRGDARPPSWHGWLHHTVDVRDG